MKCKRGLKLGFPFFSSLQLYFILFYFISIYFPLFYFIFFYVLSVSISRYRGWLCRQRRGSRSCIGSTTQCSSIQTPPTSPTSQSFGPNRFLFLSFFLSFFLFMFLFLFEDIHFFIFCSPKQCFSLSFSSLYFPSYQ